VKTKNLKTLRSKCTMQGGYLFLFVFLLWLIVMDLFFLRNCESFCILKWLVLWFLLFVLFLLWKNSNYYYEIKDDSLLIANPYKDILKIPISQIENIWIFENIPWFFRIWKKYDWLNKILFACSYSSKWIILKIKNYGVEIVICPKKFSQFYDALYNLIYKNGTSKRVNNRKN
jgi:hypothetical protein